MAKLEKTFHTFSERYERVKGGSLGAGGAGDVHKVTSSSGEELAIKILRPESATREKRKRFKNEFVFCSQPRHKNIVRYVDSGVILRTDDSEVPFIVLPLYEGTLRLLKDSSGTEKIHAFSKVLDGMEAAHLMSIVHRDLKPENILVNREKEDVVVADCGIAHFSEADLATAVATKENSKLANFAYAAPEQRMVGGTTDARTDVFALGLMLNEMFTGLVPYGESYTTIGSIEESFGYLDTVVQTAIQSRPENRYQSVQEMKFAIMGAHVANVEAQKYNELSRKVVKESEPVDPLIKDPPLISHFDYDNGTLRCLLSKPVTQQWAGVWAKISAPYTLGYEPSAWKIWGKDISIVCSVSDAERLSAAAKKYVEVTNRDYHTFVVTKTAKEAREAAERRKRELAEAKERIRLISRLNS